jgi:excisionase family DNA binding protein
MDIRGAAKVLRCSVPTVERLVAAGRVPSIKVGRLRRFRRGDLLALNEKGGPDE